jgi:hypothetical protein
MKKPKRDLVFLFDVDNTLLDNDRIQRDLYHHLGRSYGPRACQRYIAIFEELHREIGYADYLGALERYRLEHLQDPRLLRAANWLVEYPFAKRLYTQVFEVTRKSFESILISFPLALPTAWACSHHRDYKNIHGAFLGKRLIGPSLSLRLKQS